MLSFPLHGRTVPAAITLTSIALSAVFMAQGASYLVAVWLLHVALPLPAAPLQPGDAPTGAEPTEIDRSIHAQSESEFTVDRTLVDRIVSDSTQPSGYCGIVPHEEGGRVVGVKIYGIRGKSLLAKLGMQNGDLLRTINGIDVSDPSGALEAYALLRSANRISVAIVRRGQPLTLEYDVH